MPELTYASFMVRLWRDPAPAAGPEQEPVWLGELESIQTGRAWQFEGLEPLLALMAAQLRAQSPNSRNLEESS
jgi:hypothetical protein